MTHKQNRVSKRELMNVIDRANQTEKVNIEMISWDKPHTMVIKQKNLDPEHKALYIFLDIKEFILKLPIWED